MNDLATPAAVPAPVNPATDRLIPDPVGPITDRAHKGFRRAGRNERGRG